MSDTIFHEMNNADPNERVQVGSYRVDGHGHQKLKDVKYFPCFAFRIISIFFCRYQSPKQDTMRRMF